MKEKWFGLKHSFVVCFFNLVCICVCVCGYIFIYTCFTSNSKWQHLWDKRQLSSLCKHANFRNAESHMCVWVCERVSEWASERVCLQETCHTLLKPDLNVLTYGSWNPAWSCPEMQSLSSQNNKHPHMANTNTLTHTLYLDTQTHTWLPTDMRQTCTYTKHARTSRRVSQISNTRTYVELQTHLPTHQVPLTQILHDCLPLSYMQYSTQTHALLSTHHGPQQFFQG